MGFKDECQALLDEKEKIKHKQSEILLLEQLEEIKKLATIIRDRIKQIYNREEYVICSSGEKIVHFFEPFPNWSLSFGRKEVIRKGNGVFHNKHSTKYNHIIEIDERTILLADELKSILYEDGIIVDGPYIIHSFQYYAIDVYNDWGEQIGFHPIITSAEKDIKNRSWKKWCYLFQHNTPFDWKYKYISFNNQYYESSVYLIAVEITMVI